MTDLGGALLYFAVFLLSTTLHEAAHAWAALKLGDPTAYHGGQVSIDPRPHIRREPFGMVVLPLISVLISGQPLGFASAPYDPEWAQRYPRRAAWMALAGPASNLLLVLVSVLLLRVGVFAGVFDAPESVNFGSVVAASSPTWHAVGRCLSAVFSMNLLLMAFNLLPVPPLDGSAVLALGLTQDGARRYQNFLRSTPMLGWIGMLIAWQVFDVLFDPVFTAAINLLYPGVWYG